MVSDVHFILAKIPSQIEGVELNASKATGRSRKNKCLQFGQKPPSDNKTHSGSLRAFVFAVGNLRFGFLSATAFDCRFCFEIADQFYEKTTMKSLE
ncbi:hypothetical protein GWI33_016657 [Rhynchophorus ferrugineus]|uniref:Uncharacterized protein n=1 Tax=Rhynchophorus ferrugineus TaxID=354439 RepID=A0A834MA27_RHYFE|nr:hypothetical protein GWI33_016657 [Rhynchophorus ferrugineus]